MILQGVSIISAGNAPNGATVQVLGPGDLQLNGTTLTYDDVGGTNHGTLGIESAPVILTDCTAEFSDGGAGVSTSPDLEVTLANATISSLGAGLFPAFAAAVSGLTVTFTDKTSPEYADTWGWNFGDGGTSTQQNPPPHTYATAGTYTVVLSVSYASGPSATCSIPVTVA